MNHAQVASFAPGSSTEIIVSNKFVTDNLEQLSADGAAGYVTKTKKGMPLLSHTQLGGVSRQSSNLISRSSSSVAGVSSCSKKISR
jgi:hypothetical protein